MGRGWAVAAAGGALVLSACGAMPANDDASDAAAGGEPVALESDTPTAVPQGVDVSARALSGLRLIDRAPDQIPPYDRDAFGSSWADTDDNGCNQRDDVLLRDADPDTVRVQQQGPCDHDVLAGRWIDPYTGRTLELDDLKDLSQAQAVQIDHIVPLAEAWISGASGWSEDRRAEYANDLDGLLAVDGPTNASKGSSDPAAWRPKKSFQCEYAVRWIAIKTAWDLGADSSEIAALREQLGFCGT